MSFVGFAICLNRKDTNVNSITTTPTFIQKLKEMSLPEIDDNDSPELFILKEGTIIDYDEGGDSYVKVTVVEVHWDGGMESYNSIMFDNDR